MLNTLATMPTVPSLVLCLAAGVIIPITFPVGLTNLNEMFERLIKVACGTASS